jgi:hypothetical protein
MHAGNDRPDLTTEAPPAPDPFDHLDLLTNAPAPSRILRPDLSTEAPAAPRVERPDLTTDAPAPPPADRTDLLADLPSGVVPVLPVPPAMPPGGFVWGRATGTLYSWLLDPDQHDTWRLFDQPYYRDRRFATTGPLNRWGPALNRSWIVSGRAGVGPDWSALSANEQWTVSGRAGYGPDWSALDR